MTRLLLAAAVAATLATGARAETVDFDEFDTDFVGPDPFTSGSLQFSTTGPLLGVSTQPPDRGDYNGTPYLLTGYTGTLTVRRIDGGAFALDSFDAALGWYERRFLVQLPVTYHLADGSDLSGLLNLTRRYRTYTPGVTVTSVDFAIGAVRGGYLSMDNLQIAVPQAAAVPEPATWALFALGGVAVAGAARRRAVS